jgi:LysR family transcriptional activator of nhaA
VIRLCFEFDNTFALRENFGKSEDMLTQQHLNYHHLRYFWEVARHGSLRVAAAKLGVSQPTISAQVKALEESLDRQLFSRSGRGLRLTIAGRTVMDHATEIFGLGGRLVEVLNGAESKQPARLNLGIADSFAKLFAWNLIRPALKEHPGLFVACYEGKAPELLGQLVTGKLDVVLSDEPASASLPIKAFNHHLGEVPVVFCASEELAKELRPGFPKSLNEAPILLPAAQTAWRHHLDHWFEMQGVKPRVVAEFDDSALMKTAAADGLGVVAVAAPVVAEAKARFDLHSISEALNCGFPSYLITVERSLKHPSVRTIAKEARRYFKPSGSGVQSANQIQFSSNSDDHRV